MTLTLNIIFCAGTVRILRLGAFSLLKHTPYNLRIVGNGLGSKEGEQLSRFCELSERITYLDFPTKRILPHDTMLALLFDRYPDDSFAIVDSDIFALRPVAEQIDADASNHDIFSYTDPVSTEFRAEVERRFDGEVPAGRARRRDRIRTYFAVFRSSVVRSVQEKTGVGLHVYTRGTQIPAAAWDIIDPERTTFKGHADTAELLAMLASKMGFRVAQRSNNGLLHLGNMTRADRPKLLEALTDEDLFGSASDEPARKAKGVPADPQAEVERFRKKLKRVRRGFRNYFSSLLTYALKGKPGPRLKITLPAARARLVEIESELQALASEFRRSVGE